ncbi:hypothetical protein SynPROS71_02859 [Synechococcus sp. PROS-7-1]|uniref:hypothetical protein n=1 Tax=Synechococcus sp. PROS-7-1 TaxID=1442556 RepID=UPI0016491908|nr:hypothetical protein [Synechococcus sp. PROS-7-1]QNI86614.1 hypothetical protein SynPROS71_02859 [Synechococcus sp. PROS-7-1]
MSSTLLVIQHVDHEGPEMANTFFTSPGNCQQRSLKLIPIEKEPSTTEAMNLHQYKWPGTQA